MKLTHKPSLVNPMKRQCGAALALPLLAILLFIGCGSDSEQTAHCIPTPGASTCTGSVNNGFGGTAPMINQRMYMTPRNY